MSAPLVLAGEVYGNAGVVSDHAFTDRWGHVCVTCICDCGRAFSIRRSDLVRGHTTSCGCRKGKHLKQFGGRC